MLKLAPVKQKLPGLEFQLEAATTVPSGASQLLVSVSLVVTMASK